MTDNRTRLRKMEIVALVVVVAFGIFLRLPSVLFRGDSAPFRQVAFLHLQSKWNAMQLVGVDENLYREYVDELSQNGLRDYPNIVLHYIETQLKSPGAVLPPVRFLYVFTAYIWRSVFRTDALEALRDVASFFSMLTLGVAAMFAWRMRGHPWLLGVTALVAFAPTQIHMSQHALVDGFFTFWALLTLWTLWENLRAPRDWRWLTGYTTSLALLVLTKENSFFVCVAIVVLLIANHWLQFGTLTRELIVATIVGPLLAVVVLVLLAGGIDVLIGTYRLLVGKAYQLPYAIRTGDGPWQRYLVDLILVSPIVVILAFRTIFRMNRTMKPELFMSIFVAASYLVMCNVKYGMNLRYANMWDMPLRFLAFSSVAAIVAPLRRYQGLVLALVVALICAFELREYYVLFVKFGLYELVTEGLLRALNILK